MAAKISVIPALQYKDAKAAIEFPLHGVRLREERCL
jgi:hypothetical protein